MCDNETYSIKQEYIWLQFYNPHQSHFASSLTCEPLHMVWYVEKEADLL